MVGDTISGEVPAILNVIVLESIFRAEASHLRGIAAVCLFWIPPPPISLLQDVESHRSCS